jgi:hypothetical protein
MVQQPTPLCHRSTFYEEIQACGGEVGDVYHMYKRGEVCVITWEEKIFNVEN